MAFKYRGGGRTSEHVSKRSKESSGSYDSYLTPGIQRYKPREGENRIRIMPPPDFGETPKGKIRQKKYEQKWGPGWEIMTQLHRNVGADNGTYLCLAKMRDEECPVCDAKPDMDEDEADEMRLQKRPFCWVIDRDNEKAGPMVWDMPMGVFRDINTRSLDRRSGAVIKVDHPTNGFDIMFTREGTDKKTKYIGVEVERDPSPLTENERKMERWLDYINTNPLPSVLNFYDPEHIGKMLHGMAKRKPVEEDEEEDEEEETTTRRRKKKPAGRRRPADDDEEVEEEEDEEEETTTRRKKKRRPVADEDEEEEDLDEVEEDEEEEEEDAPPKKRKKRRPVADEDEEEEEEEEDDPPPRKRRKAPVDEEEEEEEDDPPKRKKRRPADDDEEEEEETDEDEEEEEETPRARRKLKRLKRRAK
jgi:hypothetical protein